MATGLVGYSGFVGQNLMNQYEFTNLYNSKNYRELQGKSFELLVCAGISAEMWLANNSPKEDLSRILELVEVLKKTHCEKIVLISTTAVYKSAVKNTNEDSQNEYEEDIAYGANRRRAEIELQNHFKDRCLILRLPALFGQGLRKNFIFDIINRCPKFLTKEKFQELSLNDENGEFHRYYLLNEKQMYELDSNISNEEKKELIKFFEKNNFTALNFTHCDSKYQFYGLINLWSDISTAIQNNIRSLNICSEPVSAKEIASHFFNIKFENQTTAKLYDYDMQTKHHKLWGNNKPYLYSKENTFKDLKNYFQENRL